MVQSEACLELEGSPKGSILIVGAGSLGSGLAAMACIAGFNTYLLARRTSYDRVAGGYLFMPGPDSAPEPVHPKVVLCDEEPMEPVEFDLCIVAVKTYDTESATRALSNLISRNTIVMSLQNGIGLVQIIRGVLASKHKENAVVRSVTSHGFNWTEEVCVHAGAGRTVIGPYGSHEKEAASAALMIQEMGIEVESSLDMRKEEWGKAVVNAAINPITAIVGCENGKLEQDERLSRLWRDVVTECVKLAPQDLGLELVATQDLVQQVILHTGPNRSSMLQDVIAGRKTEVEHINGAFVQQAEDSGRSAPLNGCLVSLVSALHPLG